MVAFNPYLLLIVPMLLGLLAQAWVRKVYAQYKATPNQLGASGLVVAQRLLALQGLTGVAVERTPGQLTDHYDPQAKTLRLSEGVADSSSVTSLGIVAHEIGHAAQDAEGYRAMRARTRLARRLSLVARWSPLVFVGGMVLGIPVLMVLGVLMLAGQAIFALVTVPVERNASVRALTMLEQTGLAAAERAGVRRVLRAAAFTYLAGLSQRLATFLFFVVVVIMARGT